MSRRYYNVSRRITSYQDGVICCQDAQHIFKTYSVLITRLDNTRLENTRLDNTRLENQYIFQDVSSTTYVVKTLDLYVLIIRRGGQSYVVEDTS